MPLALALLVAVATGLLAFRILTLPKRTPVALWEDFVDALKLVFGVHPKTTKGNTQHE